MDKKAISKVVSQAKAESKKRKFTQAVDLSIALKDLDLKNPSNRFSADVLMPHNVTDAVNVCVIGDGEIIENAKAAGLEFTLTQQQVEEFAKNPNDAKAFIGNIDYFLAQPKMMAVVGKSLGRYLGPAGKMPAVLPPNSDIGAIAGRYSRTVRIRLRQNLVLNCKIGNEAMTEDDLTDNIATLLNEVLKHLSNGVNNIKKVYVKTTMGPAKVLPRL